MKKQKLLPATVNTRQYPQPVHKNSRSTVTLFLYDFYGLIQLFARFIRVTFCTIFKHSTWNSILYTQNSELHITTTIT